MTDLIYIDNMVTISKAVIAMKPRSAVLACLICLGTAGAIAGFDPQSSLPDIGNTAQQTMSLSEEQRLGDEVMRYVRRAEPLVEDPELNEYISHLGNRLASYLPSQAFPYTFFIVQSPVINARAQFGGYIGLNAGLILTSQSENELASVVAHEIAHVSQRHLARNLEANQRISLPSMAGIIAAILLASQGSQASMAALYGGMAGSIQSQLNFTRGNEEEADRVGIQLLSDSGMDPRGMAGFFSRLQSNSRYSEFAVPEILRTHPVTLNRLSEAQSRAERLPAANSPDSMGYLLARAKLSVLLSNNLPLLRQQLAQRLDNERPPQQYATRYALAYAALLANAPREAISHINQLMAQDSRRPSYLRMLGDAQLAAGDTPHAIRTFQQANELHPYNLSLTTGYIETLLASNQGAQAYTVLDEYLRNKPITLPLLKLKARVADAIGNPIELHSTLADYYQQMGQTNDAIKQLEQALAHARGNPILVPKLESMLDTLKQRALREKENK